MTDFIVNERGVNLSKNILGWHYVELVAYMYDSNGKALESKYINIDADAEPDTLYVFEYEDEYFCESREELADLLRIKYNTSLTKEALEELRKILTYQFDNTTLE
jgi:hypothetical protein